MVVTVGKLHIPNAASNVIPGQVICSLDVRSADEDILDLATRFLQKMCLSVSSERNIKTIWKLVQQTGAVKCDEELNMLLAKSIGETGEEVMTLVSGAGHDAVPVAAVAPVAILFVRCFEGISHNPLEDVELEDIRAAIEISEKFIQNLVKKYTQ
jgi:allantoate deiminase